MKREPITGLRTDEAASLLRSYCPDTLGVVKSRSLLVVAVGAMGELIFILLLAAGLLYLVGRYVYEGLFLPGGALVSIGLVIFHEARSEPAPAALRQLAKPFTQVTRDGTEARIPANAAPPNSRSTNVPDATRKPTPAE
jgi:magnesium-transporting ATPase (P-type)